MATIVLPIIDVVRIRAQTMVLQMSAIVLSMKLQGREVLVPFSFLICVSVFMLKGTWRSNLLPGIQALNEIK